MKKQQIYKEALEVYGRNRQIDKCIEECSELIFSLQKWKYGHADKCDVASELADVEHTVGQMKLLVGKSVCQKKFNFKLNRLATRIKAIKNGKLKMKEMFPGIKEIHNPFSLGK